VGEREREREWAAHLVERLVDTLLGGGTFSGQLFCVALGEGVLRNLGLAEGGLQAYTIGDQFVLVALLGLVQALEGILG